MRFLVVFGAGPGHCAGRPENGRLWAPRCSVWLASPYSRNSARPQPQNRFPRPIARYPERYLESGPDRAALRLGCSASAWSKSAKDSSRRPKSRFALPRLLNRRASA